MPGQAGILPASGLDGFGYIRAQNGQQHMMHGQMQPQQQQFYSPQGYHVNQNNNFMGNTNAAEQARVYEHERAEQALSSFLMARFHVMNIYSVKSLQEAFLDSKEAQGNTKTDRTRWEDTSFGPLQNHWCL